MCNFAEQGLLFGKFVFFYSVLSNKIIRVYMNRIIFGFLVVMFPLCSMADDVPGMLVHKTDGNSLEVEIANISSIKFNDGLMVINGKDNSQQCLPLDDISQITFSTIETAISSLTRGVKSGVVTITNLSGQIVYKGKVGASELPTSLKGVYIITVNGQSHKVTIK